MDVRMLSFKPFFPTLIAYACLSGAFLGVRASFDSQANLTALGARRSVTPTHKLALVLIPFFPTVREGDPFA